MSSVIVIPPVPEGDPAGMQELAAVCKLAAGTLAFLGLDVSGAPKGMTFEGPAGAAFAERMQTFGSRLSSSAEQLQDYASRLDAAAAEVLRLLADRQRALEALAEQQARAVYVR
jgi:hypothetical protein